VTVEVINEQILTRFVTTNPSVRAKCSRSGLFHFLIHYFSCSVDSLIDQCRITQKYPGSAASGSPIAILAV
jgi:hypothetical protein